MAVPREQSEKDVRRSSDERIAVDHREEQAGRAADAGSVVDEDTARRVEINQRLANPLAGLSPAELATRGETYCRDHGITDEVDVRAFRLGAVIAANDNRFDTIDELTAREREVLEREATHRWSNPGMLYWVIAGKWTSRGSPACLPTHSGDWLTRSPPQSARYAQRSRAWMRRSSTGPSPSTRRSSASATPTACGTRGCWACATRRRTSAAPWSVAGSPNP